MKIKIYTLVSLLFLSVSAIAQVDRSKMPEPGPAPQVKLGEAKKFKLKNGLTVIMVENHKLPRVNATLTIDNPPRTEGDKAGLASMMGSLIGRGTPNITKDAFNERVDFLGANVAFGSSSAFASSLTKYFPEVLGLMADGVKNSQFTQEEFDKEQKVTLDNLKSNEKNVTGAARRVENLLTYGKNHPYGEFTSKESVQNINLADVQKEYETFYRPNNAYLIITGDFNYKATKKLVKKIFSDWEKGSIPAQSIPAVAEVDYTKIHFVNMPNAVQSEVAVINPVKLTLGDPDYFAALLANRILGGGATDRLFMNLREDKGYTYGAYSSISQSRYASRFRASASVRNMVTDSSVVELMKEINTVRFKKVSAEELENAKQAYIGSFVINAQNARTAANYALNREIYNLPDDFYETYLAKINAVTVDDVQNAAIKYFRGDKARIFITGKGIDVLKNLEKTDYPILYFDKYGNPTEKPEMTLPIPGGMTAEDVVNNYFNAIGGADKIAEVKSVVMVSAGNVQGIEITSEDKMMAPNKMTKVITGMGRVFSKVVFDGEKGYQEAQGRKIDFQAKQLEEMKAMKFPFMDEAYKTGKLDRIEPLEGNNAYVIIYGDTEVFYDVKTGLKVKEVKTAELPNGNKVQTPTTFGDYKVVNGIKFPHAIGQKMGPMSLNFEVKEIKVNEGVSDEDFK